MSDVYVCEFRKQLKTDSPKEMPHVEVCLNIYIVYAVHNNLTYTSIIFEYGLSFFMHVSHSIRFEYIYHINRLKENMQIRLRVFSPSKFLIKQFAPQRLITNYAHECSQTATRMYTANGIYIKVSIQSMGGLQGLHISQRCFLHFKVRDTKTHAHIIYKIVLVY